MNILYVRTIIWILFLCFGITFFFDVGSSIIKRILCTIGIFMLEYHIVSVIFLMFHIFLIKRILITLCIADIALCGLLFHRLKRGGFRCPKFSVSRSEVIVLLILLLMLPFTINKSEDIRSSSDMGIYFEWANRLSTNDTASVKSLEELGKISDSVDQGVLRIQEQLIGVYEKGENELGIKEYELHSLPTWSSFMALWGQLFGQYHASQVLTLYFFVAAICLFYVCGKIEKDSFGKFHAMIIFCLSPIMLYVSKCTLTEIAYICFILLGIFFLSESDKKLKILSGIYFGLLGYIHISNFIYIFAFYVVLWLLGLYKKDIIYGMVNIIQLMLYMISLYYVSAVSSVYTEMQFSRLSFLGSSNDKIIGNFSLIIFTLSIIQVISIVIFKWKSDEFIKFCDWLMPKALIVLEIIILLGVIQQGYYLGFSDKYSSGDGTWQLRETYANMGWQSLSYLNITNILRATGFLYVPFIFLYNFIRKNKKDLVPNLLLFVLLYSLFVYTFVQVDTPNNYYASRYFAMIIIPMAALLTSTFFTKKVLYSCVGIISAIYFLRYDFLFINTAPFSGQYAILKDALTNIPYGSIVLAMEDNVSTNQMLVNLLRDINGNQVYNYDNHDEVQQYYSNCDIYVISLGTVEDSSLIYRRNYSLLYNLSGENGRYMSQAPAFYTQTICLSRLENDS